MEKVRVSSKGQIVIPKALREKHAAWPGAQFHIVATATGYRLERVPEFARTQVGEVAGALHMPKTRHMNEPQMHKAVRRRAKALDDATKRR